MLSEIDDEVERPPIESIDDSALEEIEPTTISGRKDLNDVGNGVRFTKRAGGRFRWHAGGKVWLAWDGNHFEVDANNRVVQHAKDMARDIYRDAARCRRPEDREATARWANDSQSVARIMAAIEMAKSEPGIPVTREELDRDPYLLNVKNGTVDLRTGVLRRPQPSDLITRCTGVRCADESEGPPLRWLAFLKRTFSGDLEVIDYIQRLMGYSLIGEQSEHLLVVLLGDGANGKGTLSKVWMRLLGEGKYAMSAKSNFLMASNRNSHPTELADLYKKRLAVVDESNEDCRLDEGLVKSTTGGGRIRARRMHQDFWEFDATHLTALVTNHKPTINGTDDGIWRRVRLIHFPNRFEGKECDPHLARKLCDELPQITRWAVDGALKYQDSGLSDPASVMVATNAYRAQSNAVGRWLSECTRRKDGNECRASEAYEHFKSWSDRNEGGTISFRKFGEQIARAGIVKRSSNGTWYTGLSLISEAELEGSEGWKGVPAI